MQGNRRQPRTVALFCMPEFGHFQALRPLIAQFAASGFSAHVFTHAGFQPEIERHGGRFVDLFARYPLDQADDQSRPVPCRYVSFAGHYAERVIEDLRRIAPALICYESFAVIGPVVGQALGIPYVNVIPGHNLNPTRLLSELQNDPRVSISASCWRAAGRLRDDFGFPDASPFSYVSAVSPWLNLYGEPPQFLTAQERDSLSPLAFFGCLPQLPREAASHHSDFGLTASPPNALRVYVSLGTVIWRYFAREAAAMLRVLSLACAELPRSQVVISLGGANVDPALLEGVPSANVRVVPYADQARALAASDVFVTHHGLNSTHEAIANRVPMISYPLFWDQPALARKCQELGLAIPLTTSVRAVPTVSDVLSALKRFERERGQMQASLQRAWQWERQMMARRGEVMQRILRMTEDSLLHSSQPGAERGASRRIPTGRQAIAAGVY
jgi:MGT family glycosyltransferase